MYDTIQIFKEKTPLLSVYSEYEVLAPHYEEIVVIGGSYGGRIAAAMPKYEDLVKEIVLLYPWFAAADSNQLWHPEEDDEEFMRTYLLGYKSLYRFEEWKDFYESMLTIEGLFSEEDLWHLSDTKVFVWHGTADDVIRSGRSEQFVEKLKTLHPWGNYHYAPYYGLDHGGIAKEAILSWWLHRRQQFAQ